MQAMSQNHYERGKRQMTDKMPAAKFPPWGYLPNERADLPMHEHQPDMVNSPPHYRQGGIECIDAIEAMLSKTEYQGMLKGNILKYLWRENYKGRLESLKKAQWYLNKLVESYENPST
jgi:hypothetical protein